MPEQSNEKILKLLQEKVLLKEEVFEKSKSVFEEIKKKLSQLSNDLALSVKSISNAVNIDFKNTSDFEVEFTLADETLVFVLHTNIFTFDKTHEIWKNKYVQQDSKRAYCGKIFIYNFLSDSFRYNRTNDLGYLIARIFVNREGHYFVEGKKQLGYLYNDFATTVLDSENIQKLIETAVLFSLDFDLFTPPFEVSSEISVKEIFDSNLQSRISTGKRLGFQFNADKNQING